MNTEAVLDRIEKKVNFGVSLKETIRLDAYYAVIA